MNKTKWTWWLFFVAVFSLSAVKAIAGEGEFNYNDYNNSSVHCDQMNNQNTTPDYFTSTSDSGYSSSEAAQ